METVIRGFAVYLFLMLIFRLAGKRTLAQATTFDLALLLIISEVTQQAMVDEDKSFTNGALLIMTPIGADILFSHLKLRMPRFDRTIDNAPVILLENGRPLKDKMHKERVTEDDILVSARRNHGLERLDQIKYAVLEVSGEISVIPA